MVPLTSNTTSVPFEPSYEVVTVKSLTQQHIGEKLSQPSKHSSNGVLTHTNFIGIPSLNSNQKVQSCSILPPSKTQDIILQCSQNKVINSSSYSKNPLFSLPDHHQRTLLRSNQNVMNTPLPYHKLQTTSSINPRTLPKHHQVALSSQLPVTKPQTTSLDNCLLPSLKSDQRVIHSSFPLVNHQETPYLDRLWTSSSLQPNKKALSATTSQHKPQKRSSLNSLWTSLIDHSQRSLSSPSLNSAPQTHCLLQKSPLLEPNQMTLRSSLTDSRSQIKSVSNSNSCGLNLALSHSRSKNSLLPHSIHQPQSLFQAKSPSLLICDHIIKTPNSPVCHFAFRSPTSLNDKHRTLTPFHTKLSISGQSPSRSKHSIRARTTSVVYLRPQNKSSCDFWAKIKPKKEIPWTLHFTNPCIVKGGTLSDDVVNKIINSLSKSRIQRDLCRQILYRRMRGKPNPRPGPRLSASYLVCLNCASCIKYQCPHLTGKKDPCGATLFVIPTPELSSEGKIEVKLIFILSLPETSIFSSLPLFVKRNQPDEEAPEDNLERMEKKSKLFSTSELAISQELNVKKEWLPVAPENKVVSQQSPAVDWLLYVKKNNSQSQIPPLSSSPSIASFSSSSSSSSFSSFSSLSSTSSFIKKSSPTPPVKETASATLSGYVLNNMLSYHKLPPGVSWLEYIHSNNDQPLPTQSPAQKKMPTDNDTIPNETKGPKALYKLIQTPSK
ncbi:casein kinase II subunit alpha'-interacting protein [Suncus etruscus]|uniref:casein kinase II subunit alpha'-interacting protein n=1 Tax=Suncus etruscus TaxID=109475 RepID=UPI0021104B9B|nr:casein kinase II subunit alpha'-interacting protein [Suncus etruscus]